MTPLQYALAAFAFCGAAMLAENLFSKLLALLIRWVEEEKTH